MDMETREGRCAAICWIAGAVVAILAYVLMRPGVWLLLALAIAILLGVLVAVLLIRMVCPSGDAEKPEETGERSPGAVAAPEAAPAPSRTGGDGASSTEARPAADTPPRPEPGADGASAAEAVPAPRSGLKVPDDGATEEFDDAQEGASTMNTSAAAFDDPETDEGTQPEGLPGPRDGGADDLKRIKGVGPKLEGMLNDLGIWHFDQVAGWGAAEVAWMDANLKGFKGRVSRDDWIGQATELAAGGETEFSKRVDDGDVY